MLIILIFQLPDLVFSQYDAYRAYYVIGENVNLRADSTIKSIVETQFAYGEEIYCKKINKHWYFYDNGYDVGYISSRFIVSGDRFIKIASKKEKKNGITLYSLQKLYLKRGLIDQAFNASIRIINSYKKKEYPSRRESCVYYGEETFNNIIRNDDRVINYKSQRVFDFCKIVIQESKDSLITVMGLISLSKYYLENGNPNQAMHFLLKALKDYGNYLLVPNWCDYDSYRRTSLMETIRDLKLNTKVKNESVNYTYFKNELLKICNSRKASLASKALACELIVRIDQ